MCLKNVPIIVFPFFLVCPCKPEWFEMRQKEPVRACMKKRKKHV